jgi:5-oxoprolinase (ATP-hydrolysing)
MDDGTPIVVAVTVSPSGEALVDFTGTGPSSPGNLNANPAIVRAAVLYSFRCLLDEEVPLNDGFLTPIRIVVPPGSLLAPEAGPDPSARPAVVAGNVETSQRVVDVLLGALGAAAASQGTMNNLLFGRAATPSRPGFGYYETICGGAGAGPTFDGESAVHTHMTNTRITDPEVLEERYPVRLLRFEIRRGSGGAGQHRGGDGVIREIEALEPLEASLVTGRRVFAPYGVCGGAPGSPGRNILRRSGATTVEELGPMAAVSLLPGDVLRLETPGGGGWGSVT